MAPRPALAVSLYLDGKTVVIVTDDHRSRPMAPAIIDRLDRLRAARAQVIAVTPDQYHKELCQGAFLVMAHSSDFGVNRRVADDARTAGCLCYVHDGPDMSDMAMPALARRGPLSLAISTDAVAPALAGRLRAQVQALLDDAGRALDALLADMAAERARHAQGRAGRLGALARRLRILGRIVVDARATPERHD